MIGDTLYTLGFYRDGKPYLLEKVSFDSDKTRWTFGRNTPCHWTDYDTCVELLISAKESVPGVEIMEFVQIPPV